MQNQADALALRFSANSLLLSACFSYAGNMLEQFKTLLDLEPVKTTFILKELNIK